MKNKPAACNQLAAKSVERPDMKFAHIVIAVALAGALSVQAQTTSDAGADHAGHAAHQAPAAAAAPQSEGEVRKIDREQNKVTLRHGPLENLGMPAMTMVFRAADPRMLDGLKEGDKVKFRAEKVNGAFTVTAMQPEK